MVTGRQVSVLTVSMLTTCVPENSLFDGSATNAVWTRGLLRYGLLKVELFHCHLSTQLVFRTDLLHQDLRSQEAAACQTQKWSRGP
jgi:hypothetical protein